MQVQILQHINKMADVAANLFRPLDVAWVEYVSK